MASSTQQTTLLDLPNELLLNIYKFIVEDVTVKYSPRQSRARSKGPRWEELAADAEEYDWWAQPCIEDTTAASDIAMLFVCKRERQPFEATMLQYATIAVDSFHGISSFIITQRARADLVRKLKLLHYDRLAVSDRERQEETCFLVAHKFFRMLNKVKIIEVDFGMTFCVTTRFNPKGWHKSHDVKLEGALWGLLSLQPGNLHSQTIAPAWLGHVIMRSQAFFGVGDAQVPQVYGTAQLLLRSP